MGVGFVIFVRRQPVEKSPSTAADPVNQAFFHQKVQNAIYGHPIDGRVAVQGREYFSGA
jgi:hypothetical protein